MTDLFEYRRGDKPMGDVIPFVKSDRQIEHVDSTTIVEKLEMTDEMKQKFKDAGIDVEEQA